MEPPIDSFWAKIRPYRGEEVEAWHPLPAHAADVAACTEALLRNTLLRRRLARLGGEENLTAVQIDRLSVLAALHDLGKYNVGFQNKRLERPPFTAGHVEEALAAFGSPAGVRIGEALRFGTMMDWGEEETTFEDLLVTALGHHGRPVPPGQRLMQRVWEPTENLNPFQGLSELRDAVEVWYPDAFEPGGEPLPDSNRFQHGFNGVLTLADWLGSNEEFFPYAEAGDSRRIEFARSRAEEAVAHMGLDATRARSGLIDRPPAFTNLWEFEPRPAQRLLGELPAQGDRSLSILEAPTGSGKTEAALMRFFRLFAAGEVDGLYFALPTRAAASQMYDRVREAVKTAIPDPEARPPVVRAVPGYLSDGNARGSLLDERGALWDDDDLRWRYLSWASERPKRYLAGAVAVGTVDQVLLSALAVDHSHLRAASLLRHLVVVDEVHASDAYMSSLLEAVLERHLAAGGHAMLMSATLGERARHRYLELASGQDRSPAALEEARKFPYPVVVHSARGEAPQAEAVDAVELSRKDVEVELAPAMEEPDDVAGRALSAADAGARVLVIRNTVAGCRSLQQALEDRAGGLEDERLFRCASTPAPHHSRFAVPDRKALDGAVEQVFGKDSSSERVVLAATQTVEQSLDIDADLLVTDLCPADVLLQRIGRLHRHGRRRPDGFDQPRVVVLVPESPEFGQHIRTRGEYAGHASGPHGIGTVYEDLRVLAATWSELRDRRRIHLPSESRPLVEAATHSEALEDVVRNRERAWADHAQAMEGVRRAEAGLANLNLADWSARFGHPESLFPERPGERVRTRLGEGDRRAVLSEEITGPFGHPVREITVPAWMAPDAVEEEGAAVVRSESGEAEFRFGSGRYRYDRLGLRRLDSAS